MLYCAGVSNCFHSASVLTTSTPSKTSSEDAGFAAFAAGAGVAAATALFSDCDDVEREHAAATKMPATKTTRKANINVYFMIFIDVTKISPLLCRCISAVKLFRIHKFY